MTLEQLTRRCKITGMTLRPLKLNDIKDNKIYEIVNDNEITLAKELENGEMKIITKSYEKAENHDLHVFLKNTYSMSESYESKYIKEVSLKLLRDGIYILSEKHPSITVAFFVGKNINSLTMILKNLNRTTHHATLNEDDDIFDLYNTSLDKLGIFSKKNVWAVGVKYLIYEDLKNIDITNDIKKVVLMTTDGKKITENEYIIDDKYNNWSINDEISVFYHEAELRIFGIQPEEESFKYSNISILEKAIEEITKDVNAGVDFDPLSGITTTRTTRISVLYKPIFNKVENDEAVTEAEFIIVGYSVQLLSVKDTTEVDYTTIKLESIDPIHIDKDGKMTKLEV